MKFEDYALLCSKEIEDNKREDSWGSLKWFAGQSLGNAQDVTVGRVIINKGNSNPRHAHSSCEEVLYLLKGKLEHSVGDKKVILNAGDVITVNAGVMHNAVNVGDEDADMLVVFSSGVRDFIPEK